MIAVRFLAIDVEFRLDAQFEDQPACARPGERPFQDGSRTVRVRFAMVIQIAGEPGVALVPWQHDERVQVRHRGAFVFLRADQSHALHCADREQFRAARHLRETGERHRFGFRHAVHVHIGREAIFYPGLHKPLPGLFDKGRIVHDSTPSAMVRAPLVDQPSTRSSTQLLNTWTSGSSTPRRPLIRRRGARPSFSESEIQLSSGMDLSHLP